jgi:hypothetical protein
MNGESYRLKDSKRSVTHQLWINQVYCPLKYHPIPVADVRLVRWLSFYGPLLSGTQLIPDGYAEVATPTKIFAMFLEIDLGHERRFQGCSTPSPVASPNSSIKRVS